MEMWDLQEKVGNNRQKSSVVYGLRRNRFRSKAMRERKG